MENQNNDKQISPSAVEHPLEMQQQQDGVAATSGNSVIVFVPRRLLKNVTARSLSGDCLVEEQMVLQDFEDCAIDLFQTFR